MQIQKDAFVAIDYVLTLDSGEVVDQSSPGEPLPFIFASGHIIPGLEKALEGQEEGYEGRISINPDEGYGALQPELVQEMPRERFPDDVELSAGMVFQASTPQGVVNFQVTEVTDETITADFNHPLAGQRLHFDVKVAEVRESTEDDRQALSCESDDCGHDHGPGCAGCS